VSAMLPDAADVVAAGRPFPSRDALCRYDHASAVRLIVAMRTWWLDAASGHLDLSDVDDARRALANAEYLAPRGGA